MIISKTGFDFIDEKCDLGLQLSECKTVSDEIWIMGEICALLQGKKKGNNNEKQQSNTEMYPEPKLAAGS